MATRAHADIRTTLSFHVVDRHTCMQVLEGDIKVRFPPRLMHARASALPPRQSIHHATPAMHGAGRRS